MSSHTSRQWGWDLEVGGLCILIYLPSKMRGGMFTCRAFVLLPPFFAVLISSVEEPATNGKLQHPGSVASHFKNSSIHSLLSKTATVPEMRRAVKQMSLVSDGSQDVWFRC